MRDTFSTQNFTNTDLELNKVQHVERGYLLKNK